MAIFIQNYVLKFHHNNGFQETRQYFFSENGPKIVNISFIPVSFNKIITTTL
jgi:hypothetical protein